MKKDNDVTDMADAILNEVSTGIESEHSNKSKSLKISSANTGPISTQLSPDEMKKILLNHQMQTHLNTQDPLSWLADFNKRNNISFGYKTESVKQGRSLLNINEYKALARLEAKKYKLNKVFPKQVLDDAITIWIRDQKRLFLESFQLELAYSSCDENLIEKWVYAATGNSYPLDIAVMKHFIWQIRRKIFNLEVQHHLMPILYGKSGGGKSQAVLKLLAPLDQVTLNTDFTIFGDQFKTKQFTKMYVMFFDEMAKSDRADVDKLKNVISAPTVDFRLMHTESIEYGPQNSTFIGCSNELVYDKIYDPTSARRYWQINCSDKLDWDVINSIDYIKMWKSVDENEKCPLIEFLEEIREVQNKTIRNKDLIEDWFDSIVSQAQKNAQINPTTTELYQSFKSHCEFQKINNLPSLNRFTRRLNVICEDRKFEPSYRNNRGTVWSLKISKSLSSVVNTQAVFDADAELKIQSDVADARATDSKDQNK